MAFILPSHPAHSRCPCFDRVHCRSVVSLALYAAFPPGETSYHESSSKVGWASKYLVRCRSSSVYLWKQQRDYLLHTLLADCHRLLPGIDMSIFASFKSWSAREPAERFVLSSNRFFDFFAACRYPSGRRTASLLNDFSVATPGIRFPRAISILQARHGKAPPAWDVFCWRCRYLSVCRQRS